MAFSSLSEKFKHIFAKLTRSGKLTDLEIKAAMREIKLALLEADVNIAVVKDFIAKTSEKCSGESVMQSLTPGQHIIKIVHEQMTELLGGGNAKLNIAPKPPTVIMMAGLQGAGKTTFCGKLGQLLKSQGKRVLLVADDIYRPAAIEQLKVVAHQAGVAFFEGGNKDAVKIAKEGIKHALSNNLDTVIIDTAGRLHIDNDLMQELTAIKKAVNPAEILLTVDAMTGQDAVNVAQEFNQQLDVTGVVLTKLDGDTRGGAAMSIRYVTGKPIKYSGIGEKMGDIEPFHPDRIARRILGMGDVLSIIEKAQNVITEKEMKRMEENFRRNAFTLEDFLQQYDNLAKMGNIDDILENLGGAMGGRVKMGKLDEAAMARNKAIIQSMTMEERTNPDIIKSSRKQRIAKGSGTSIQAVNQLLKQFEQSKQLMKQFGGGKMAGKMMRRFH
ncbi:MAG: signal recognition particle protein [Clostridia bacterium]|nr:signal recognition particle protein [Clostridia bacterium]